MSKLSAVEPIRHLRTQQGETPHLLLAEDSPAARILTAALLRRMGCQVDEAEHGEEALEAARLRPYHAIILDIEMPIMDGITAARAIRGLPNGKGQTPLIALSAFLADSGNAGHWLTLFDLTHAKPASREGLRHAVGKVLNLTKIAPEDQLPQKPNHLLVDQEALALMQAQLPADDWRVLMDKAMDEMRESLLGIHAALKSADRPTIQRLSHRMKGLARTFAAPSLANEAENLEHAAHHISELQSGISSLQVCFDKTIGHFQALRAA